MKLREIAHSRTGDKGNISNISVIAYDAKDYPLLLEQVTAARVKAHFAGVVLGEVVRYDFTLQNTGLLPADEAVLADPIPPNTVYVPGSLTYTQGSGGYDAVNDVITWTGSLASGGIDDPSASLAFSRSSALDITLLLSAPGMTRASGSPPAATTITSSLV